MRKLIRPKDHGDTHEITVEFGMERDKHSIDSLINGFRNNWSGDVTFEIAFEVRYDFERGYAETGPSYSCGGEPGMPDTVDINEIVFAETVCINGIFYPEGTVLRAEGVEDCSLLECALNLEDDDRLEEIILDQIYDNYADPGY